MNCKINQKVWYIDSDNCVNSSTIYEIKMTRCRDCSQLVTIELENDCKFIRYTDTNNFEMNHPSIYENEKEALDALVKELHSKLIDHNKNGLKIDFPFYGQLADALNRLQEIEKQEKEEDEEMINAWVNRNKNQNGENNADKQV